MSKAEMNTLLTPTKGELPTTREEQEELLKHLKRSSALLEGKYTEGVHHGQELLESESEQESSVSSSGSEDSRDAEYYDMTSNDSETEDDSESDSEDNARSEKASVADQAEGKEEDIDEEAKKAAFEDRIL